KKGEFYMSGKRSRRRDNPEAAAAEAMLGELTREYYTCNRLSDLLRLHPDDLHEKGGVVAGASVLTEAGGNLRLRRRPAEALAAGDVVLGWRWDQPGFLEQTVESVRSRPAPPVLVEIRTGHWKVVVAPRQLVQIYIWSKEVLHDFRMLDIYEL